MFEIGNELLNVSLNDIQQRHDVMSMEGTVVTRMQRCVQRIEVSDGEQRSSCINEMHAISSTPIRTKNARRGSPLYHRKAAPRPSIYSVALSPNVSPVGKSHDFANGYSPSEKEFSNRMDAIVPGDSAHGGESFVRIGMSHQLPGNTVGNEVKRNVSRRLPMATAFQRTEQYVPLEIVSDEDDLESKTIIKKARSCRRPVNAKRKASVHFKTNSYRDSGRGGSAAIASGTRTSFADDRHADDCSGPEEQQSDSDSGLSHCTEGPSRSHFHEEEGRDCIPSYEMGNRNRKHFSESLRFSLKEGRSRGVSRYPQHIKSHGYDYEPLEIVSDDDEDADNYGKRMPKNPSVVQQERLEVQRNLPGKGGRKKPVGADMDIAVGGDRMLSDVAGCKSLGKQALRQDENEDESLNKTEAIIDSLLKVDENDYDKENLPGRQRRPNSIRHNRNRKQSYRSDYSDEGEPVISVARSKNTEQCSESFVQDHLDEGSFRSMGDMSGSEAGGYDESNVVVDQDEDEEYDREFKTNRHRNRNWRHRAISGGEELNESFDNPDNLSTSHFHVQNQMQMSGFLEEDSRVRHEGSFHSNDQYEQDEYELGDDEDVSRNMSALYGNQAEDNLQHKRGRIPRKEVMEESCRVKSGSEGSYYSDHESQDEMVADMSGPTDYDRRRNIQSLIQSRNDSYLQQDSFDSRSIVRGKVKKYVKKSEMANIKNRVTYKKDSSQCRGTMRKSVKKGIQTKKSSAMKLKQNLSSSTKLGKHVSRKHCRAQTESSSEDVDGSIGQRQASVISVHAKTPISRKRSRKSAGETTGVAVKSGIKLGNVRGKAGSDTKSSDMTESDGPQEKVKRGRPKSAKSKALELQRGNPPSQGDSSDNSDTVRKGETIASKVYVSKNSKLVPSESTDFETPPVKGKRGRPKGAKSKVGAGQQMKGQLKSQSESSETPESGSPPKKKKRGRPPLKSKKSSDAQSEVQADIKSSDSNPEQLECSESSNFPPKKKRGHTAKVEKALPAQKKTGESSKQNQSKVHMLETEDGEAPSKEKKMAKGPGKSNKRQKLNPEAEKLEMNNDGLHVSSSDSESDKSGVPKRRPLFSSEKFTNELLLKQDEVLPEPTEKKTDVQPKLSPLRDKKKSSESSSDYLRKKVLTMRLGTSAFLNSVIEENALVVTSTPKKSSTESRTQSTSGGSLSDDVFDRNEGNTSNVDQQAISVRLDGDSEKNDNLNKSQITAEVNKPVTLPVHSNEDVLNQKIQSVDDPVSDNKSPQSSSEQAAPEGTSNATKEEPVKKIPDSAPSQSLKVNERLAGVPLTNAATAESAASSSSKSNSTKGSVPVVVDGSPVELELFADYSKIPFRCRQKESKANGVQYGAALDVLGLGTGYIHLAPGTEKGLQHPKSFNMAFLILDGQVMVKIHESDIVANPGDFFAVPKGCKYNLTGIGEKNSVVAYFKSKAL
ncbi:uncharacterized protein LOC124157159 isoform X2 [Ischnura elegans]|uniref:uncharacterized protein LOC124157159 isoform X2 n=1 Tax=Ischnura elegans TaxID=197161 RepID=UPI001ED8ABFA|nr:uncharacterized protein LOC124157159 isoform X2 [Ischnura elegans]